MRWRDLTMLFATVAGATFAGLALLRVDEVKPLLDFLNAPVHLWLTVLSVVAAVWVALRFAAVGIQATDRQTYGLKILNCKFDVIASATRANQFELDGSYDAMPPDGKGAWLISASLDGQRFWPQGKIGVVQGNNTWHGRCGLGQTHRDGEQMKIILARVGQSSEILFNYCLRTYDSLNLGHRLPLSILPPDVVVCDSKEIAKVSPREVG